jgi:hypothetical protein
MGATSGDLAAAGWSQIEDRASDQKVESTFRKDSML